MKIQITRLSDRFSDIPLPEYQSEGSAGMDIRAAIDEPIVVPAGGIVLVPTNLAIELPNGYECQVRTRSGLALRHGIFALNSPGTIDSDYRGEIKIILANFSKEPYVINRGDRIAQLVVAKYERIDWVESNKLSETTRGEGGFGSTGI
ncbi:MAG: dUTP diphosphatase [Candidatus Kapaibacteriota bacterium]|jgi:dUTP pyrophosphatase